LVSSTCSSQGVCAHARVWLWQAKAAQHRTWHGAAAVELVEPAAWRDASGGVRMASGGTGCRCSPSGHGGPAFLNATPWRLPQQPRAPQVVVCVCVLGGRGGGGAHAPGGAARRATHSAGSCRRASLPLRAGPRGRAGGEGCEGVSPTECSSTGMRVCMGGGCVCAFECRPAPWAGGRARREGGAPAGLAGGGRGVSPYPWL
jgi:hypothetical protein